MRCEDKMRTKWKNISAVPEAISCLVKLNLALRLRLRLNYEGKSSKSRLNYKNRSLRSRLNLRSKLRFEIKVKVKT
jgi:hypothetical protein